MREALRLLDGLDDFTLNFVNEAMTQSSYQRILTTGQNALDVGANRGDHSRSMAGAVGQTGKIYAVEPNPVFHPELLATPEVVLIPYAAGDFDGTVTFHIPVGLPSWASVLDIREMLPDRQFELINVKQVRLDGLSLPTMHFVKMDVEGREFEALTGLTKTLERDRCPVVFENGRPEIFELMHEIGYAVYNFFAQSDTTCILPNMVAFPAEATARLGHTSSMARKSW